MSIAKSEARRRVIHLQQLPARNASIINDGTKTHVIVSPRRKRRC